MKEGKSVDDPIITHVARGSRVFAGPHAGEVGEKAGGWQLFRGCVWIFREKRLFSKRAGINRKYEK